jgi:transcriptional regulator with XRE-family HTH domain
MDNDNKNNGSRFGSRFRSGSENQTFADRLKKRRNDFDLTQKKLAEILGIDEGTIQNYEKDKLPKGDYLILLAKELKCTTGWLLAGEGEGPDSPEGKPDPVVYNKVKGDGAFIEKGFRERYEELVIENYRLKKRIAELEETKKFARVIVNIMAKAKPPEGVVERRACATQIHKILNGMT